MKIRVLSDIHLDVSPWQAPQVDDVDLVVLAGDVGPDFEGIDWAQSQFPENRVLFVPGNHEPYGHSLPSWNDQLRAAARGTNVTVLENQAFEVDGVLFLCSTLWSDFEWRDKWVNDSRESAKRLHDFGDLIHLDDDDASLKLMPIDACEIHKASVSWLKNALAEASAEKIVVITHHAPSTQSIAEEYRDSATTAAFVSGMDDFVEQSGADLWIHGHVHTAFDYCLGSTRVVCNPRGYPGLDDGNGFMPELVVEV